MAAPPSDVSCPRFCPIVVRSAATLIRLAESAVMRCDGIVQLGPGVHITGGPHARLVIGDGTYVTCDSVIVAAFFVVCWVRGLCTWLFPGASIYLDTNFHKPSRRSIGLPERAVAIEDRVALRSEQRTNYILKGIRVA